MASPAPSSSAAKAAAASAAAMKAIKHRGETEYPKDMVYFVFSFVAAAAAINVYSVGWAYWRRYRLAKADPPSPPKAGLGRLPAAVLTACRIVSFRLRIPSINLYVLEILLSAFYLLALLLWTFCNTQNLTIKDYSDRCGHIAGAQMPIIVALAMKNNVIGWFTGLSHEKLTAIHRAVARVLLVEIWIHGWTRVVIDGPVMVQLDWRREGLVAGLVYTLMVILTVAPMRRRFYELFFIIHTTLALLLIVLTYLHTKGAGNFDFYVWPSFVIWGFDRFCRYLRYIILTNFEAPNKSPAEIELLSHDTVKVTVRRYVPFGWKAGQHMFLSFPTLGPVESHPFTIANIPEGTEKQKKLVWVIRVRDGFTKRLKEYASVKSGVATAPVFMHGPYGAPPDITPFSTCVFLAGGSGITFTLPRLRDLLEQAAAQKACARRIVFVWAIRHQTHVSWLAGELQKAAAQSLPGVEVSLAAYVTSDGPADADPGHTLDDSASGSSGDPEKDAYDEKSGGVVRVKGLEILTGRPDLYRILEDAVTKSTGPVSVDVSGPAPFVAAVRKTLSGSFASPLSVLKGTPTVQLNVENFTL